MTKIEKLEIVRELINGLDEDAIYKLTGVDVYLDNLEELTEDELDMILDCDEI